MSARTQSGELARSDNALHTAADRLSPQTGPGEIGLPE